MDPLWVSSLFREELTALRLSATETLPEASTGPPLLEIVEGIGEGIGDKSQLGRALGRLFRAILPEAAYEVSGTLRPTARGGGTISVQVVDRTHRNRTWVKTARHETSWPESARMAAAAVAGVLYSQVADRHRGPWTQWDEPVPADLVILHDEAREHEEKNRLEPAMGAYHALLARDPLNPNLRLRIAMLQERLELYLGAWVTYRAIADEAHRDSWKGGDRRVRLLALYRMAILLGNEKVALRWVYPVADPCEEASKEELREALGAERQLIRDSWWKRLSTLARMFPVEFVATSPTRLLDRLGREDKLDPGTVLVSPGAYVKAKETRGEWFGEQLGRARDEWPWEAVERIRGLQEVISLTHLEQLDTRLRRKPPWRPWRWIDWWRYRLPIRRSLERREFSLSAVRVSKLVARIRIVDSAAARSDANTPTARRIEWARGRLLLRWPFAPRPWRQPVRWLRPWHRIADRRDDAWQYHYNAACAASRALTGAATKSSLEDAKPIESGLKQLEEYVHRAGSEQVKAQADWVGREDDDLLPLRNTPEYERWARHHLPGAPNAARRPPRMETTRIAARIAHGGALAFADRWQQRAEKGGARWDLVADWWLQETAAWEALNGILGGHQSWEKRRDGISALQACLSIDGDGQPIDAAHHPEDREGKRCLTELLDGLRGSGDPRRWPAGVHIDSVRSWARDRHTATESPTAEPPHDPSAHCEEALRASRIWERLGDALHGELEDELEPTPNTRTCECLSDIRTEILA